MFMNKYTLIFENKEIENNYRISYQKRMTFIYYIFRLLPILLYWAILIFLMAKGKITLTSMMSILLMSVFIPFSIIISLKTP